jgi:hypothetical protein
MQSDLSVTDRLLAKRGESIQGTDLLAILAKNQTEPENAVSRFLHFQRLTAAKNGGTSLYRGNRE